MAENFVFFIVYLTGSSSEDGAAARFKFAWNLLEPLVNLLKINAAFPAGNVDGDLVIEGV
jgi:hypothetical protein